MAAAPANKASFSNTHVSVRQDSALPTTDDGVGDRKSALATGSHPLSLAAQHTTNASSTLQPRSTRPPPADFLSDKATVALVRRILCAQHLADRGRAAPAPLEELLPPLTSRNDVDLQLYALISIILRESIQNWYSKITPDETFVAEIVQIIAHCTRALEQRLRKVDLAGLLLDELPELIDAHVRAYRIAKDASAARPPLQSSLREVYHSIWPLPALSPVPDPAKRADADKQAENELAYRQLLVQGVLALLLPTEDLQNECLDAIVGQILSELIVNNLMIEKLSQPWLLWEISIIVTKLAHKRQTGSQQESTNQHGSKIVVPRDTRQTGTLSRFFWFIVQGAFLLASAVRMFISTVSLTRSLPPRFSPAIKTPTRADGKSYTPSISSEIHTGASDTPVALFAIWPCVGNLLEIHARMPWLHGALAMLQWGGLCGPGKIADLDGVLDRLLSHWIQTYMLSPVLLPPLLRSIRGALFPNNAPGTSTLTAPSSDKELAALKRRCARAIWAVIPKRVGRLYYGANVWAWHASSASSPLGKNETDVKSDEQRSGPLDSTSPSTAKGAGGGKERASPNRVGGGSSLGKLDDQHQQHNSAHAGVHVTQQGASQHRQRQASGRLQRQQQKKGESSMDGNFLQPHPPQQAGTTAASKTLRTPDGTRSGMAHDKTSSFANENNEEERILEEIEAGILDVFSDPYCNKHLLYGILELVIVRLMPELTDRGVVDLLEERLI